MKKRDYLDVRHALTTGLLDEKGMALFFEYWVIFRKDEYLDIDFDTFSSTFSQYLSMGNNYRVAVEKTIDYMDLIYDVVKVSSAKGELLAIT